MIVSVGIARRPVFHDFVFREFVRKHHMLLRAHEPPGTKSVYVSALKNQDTALNAGKELTYDALISQTVVGLICSQLNSNHIQNATPSLASRRSCKKLKQFCVGNSSSATSEIITLASAPHK